MTQDKHKLIPAVEPPPSPLESSAHFHGDLRKAAYLKRRAAYELQSSAPTAQQADEDNSSVIRRHKPPR